MGRLANIPKLHTDSSAKGGNLTDTKDLNRFISRYITIKIFDVKDKQKILKMPRENPPKLVVDMLTEVREQKGSRMMFKY